MQVAALCVAGILLVTRAKAYAANVDISNVPTTAVEGLGETSDNFNDEDFYISPMTQVEQDSAVTTPATGYEPELTTDSALNEVEVNATVEEVQAILAANPALPRLSTQEILDILHNITGGSGDTSSEGRKSREDYRRALMVVLPFNANNLSDTSIQELYTKRPITRIIANKTDGPLPAINSASNYDNQLGKTSIRLSQEVSTIKKNQSDQEQNTSETKPTKLYSSKYRPSQDKEPLLFDTETQAPNHRYPGAENTDQVVTRKPIQQYPFNNDFHFANNHELDRPITQKYPEFTQSALMHKQNSSSVERNKISTDTNKKPHQQQSHNHAVDPIPKHPHTEQQINKHYILNANTGQQNHQHHNQQIISTTPTKQPHQPIKRRRRPQISNHSIPLKINANNFPTRLPSTGATVTKLPLSGHHTMDSAILSPTIQTGTKYISTHAPTLPSAYITTTPIHPSAAHTTKYPVLNTNAQAAQTKIPGQATTGSSSESLNIYKQHHYETSTVKQAQPPIINYDDRIVKYRPEQGQSQLSTNFQPMQDFRVHSTDASYTTDNQQQFDVGLPNDMKDVLASMSVNKPVQDNRKPQPSILFITPSPSFQVKNQNSGLSGNSPNNETENNMHEKVREVLAAIGLFPANDTPSSTEYKAAITTAKTLTSPDASIAAESLSEEMKDLLMSLGLLPSPNEGKHSEIGHASTTKAAPLLYNPEPTINPSSYVSFKPLPISRGSGENMQEDIMNSDMKQFLASFGLVSKSETGREAQGVTRARYHKSLDSDVEQMLPGQIKLNRTLNESLRPSEIPAVNTEIMTDDMVDVLENLGLVQPRGRKSDEKKKSNKKPTKNIFKPSTHYAMLNYTKEEMQKLNKLLDIIKHLTKENGTLTPEEIQELNTTFSIPLMTVPSISSRDNMVQMGSDNDKVKTLDQIKGAPDPLFLGELFLTDDDKRNEVKRQQENSTESDTSVSSNETSSSSSSSSVTSNSTGPSLADLEDSFGGGETAPADADVTKDLPTPKPNGLYFLLDWHSFLEVGEDDKGKVNLRFEPQIGNSRNFLPVNVP